MIKRIISTCCMAVSVVLMALPYGVAMTFWYSGPPDFETVTLYYSYFNMMPLGYGNIFPMITAMLSSGVLMRLLIGIIAVVRKRRNSDDIGKPTFILLMICIIASVLSWVIFSAITVIGVIVVILHAAAFILLLNRKAADAVLS